MSTEIESASPTEQWAPLAEVAREAAASGATIRQILDAAIARGIVAGHVSEPDRLADELDVIAADAVAAVAKLVEIAIDQQGIGSVGIGALALTDLIFQAPVMSTERREPEEGSE